MAVQVAALFSPTVLLTSVSAIYTVTAQPSSLVLAGARVRLANTTITATSFTAYAVPSGGSPGAANCIANAESVAPNSHTDLDIPVLAVGGSLQALASAGSALTMSQLMGVLFS